MVTLFVTTDGWGANKDPTGGGWKRRGWWFTNRIAFCGGYWKRTLTHVQTE
jgi:hypothetical protein